MARALTPSKLPHLFERFYQADTLHPHGSGVGLSVAALFVHLHAGTISATSEGLGKGLTVTIQIENREKSIEKSKVTAKDENHMVHSSSANDIGPKIPNIPIIPISPSTPDDDDPRPLIEVIDDNPDIYSLICSLLGSDYRLCYASNGEAGIATASKEVPDAIICDVMMPGIDGISTCRRLKEERITSHIPVMMLTACAADEQRIASYDSGADGFLSKPFSPALLRAKLASLLANRRRILEIMGTTNDEGDSCGNASGSLHNPKKSEGLQTGVEGASQHSAAIDTAFYKEFLDIFNARIADQELNIDILAHAMAMGRSQFYRKLKALTGEAPVDLLARLRLERARELLATTDTNIQEIAYAVGFASPAYFTRRFREAFGITPSQFRQQQPSASKHS